MLSTIILIFGFIVICLIAVSAFFANKIFTGFMRAYEGIDAIEITEQPEKRRV